MFGLDTTSRQMYNFITNFSMMFLKWNRTGSVERVLRIQWIQFIDMFIKNAHAHRWKSKIHLCVRNKTKNWYVICNMWHTKKWKRDNIHQQFALNLLLISSVSFSNLLCMFKMKNDPNKVTSSSICMCMCFCDYVCLQKKMNEAKIVFALRITCILCMFFFVSINILNILRMIIEHTSKIVPLDKSLHIFSVFLGDTVTKCISNVLCIRLIGNNYFKMRIFCFFFPCLCIRLYGFLFLIFFICRQFFYLYDISFDDKLQNKIINII